MGRCLKKTQEEYEGHVSYPAFITKSFQDTRDMMIEEFKKLDFPIKLMVPESGYFIMADISECKDMIPQKYFESNEYEDDKETQVVKNIFENKEGKIPMDLAFARWMGYEKGVVFMPGVFFYAKGSEYLEDKYARFAICKEMEATREAVKKFHK